MKSNKSINNKKIKRNILGLSFLLLGAQIGAGYASGKETVAFFGDYGYTNIVLVLVLVLGYSSILVSYASMAKRLNTTKVADITKNVFGKYSLIPNILLLNALFSAVFATIAGLDIVAKNTFTNYSFPWVSIIVSFIAALIVSGGFKSILKAASLTVPLLVTALIATVGYFLFFGTHSTEAIAQPFSYAGLGLGAISALSYVGFNLNSSSSIITQVSGKYSKKELNIGGMIFAAVFALGVGIIILTVYLGGTTIFGAEMPMLTLSKSISAGLGMFYNIALFMAICMTLIGMLFSLSHWFEKYVKNKTVLVAILTVFGFAVSRVGFGFIIEYLYPVAGIGGLFVGVCVLLKNLKYINKEQNKNNN